MTGSMNLKSSRYGVSTLFISSQGAHPHSTNAYNAAAETLNNARSSHSPVETEINFLTTWIDLYNSKRSASTVKLDSFLNPVTTPGGQASQAKSNKVPQVKSLQISKPKTPQVKSLQPVGFGVMKKSGPAVGFGVGPVRPQIGNPTTSPKTIVTPKK